MFCQAICDGEKNDICLRTYTQGEHSIYLSGQFLQKIFLWTNGPPIPGMCNMLSNVRFTEMCRSAFDVHFYRPCLFFSRFVIILI